MLNYILFTGATFFIYYNFTNIIWFIFYYYAYVRHFLNNHLSIKNTSSKNNDKMYLGILKKNKKVVEYDYSKKENYLFYFCKNYETCDLKTDYKFIAITLNIFHDNKRETHTIDLQNTDTTFYLENNRILSKEFITWYCSFYGIKAFFNNNYNLSIIDDKANIKTIRPDECIELSKKTYEIKNIN